MTQQREWIFYVTDEDRSWGFSNHVYTLGAAFTGYGETPNAAMAEAKESQRDDIKGYIEFSKVEGELYVSDGEEHFLAIPVDAEKSATLKA